jgi:hypothetical protein
MIRRVASLSVVHAFMVLGFVSGAVLIQFADARTEARVLLCAMTVLCLGFSIQYAVRSPWRSTQGGKALMYTTASLGVLGLYLLCSWVFGAFQYRDELRSYLFLFLVLSLLYRYCLLFMYQRKARRFDYEPTFPTDSYVPTDSKEADDGVR